MKIIYENKTKYTKEAYNNFLKFHQKKYNLRYELFTIFIIILLIFCSVVNFMSNHSNIALIFIFIIIGFFLYRHINPIKKIKKEFRKIKNETEFTFDFYDKYFIVSGDKKDEKIRYWSIRRVYDNKDYIFLYKDKENAFVLKKDCFLIGDKNTFIKFIKRKTWYKIHINFDKFTKYFKFINKNR